MQTLYQAANAVEAHMILHLLKQDGIHGHVLGEHLQGAMGELPAAGFVRVTVEDADYARGRELIKAWESSLPADDGTASAASVATTARRGKAWTMLVIGLAVGVAATYGVYRVPARQQAFDHNSDGVPDETWTYSVNGTGITYEADRNLDGKPDYLVQYARGGLMTEARSDDDFDGVMETRTTFVNNRPGLVETDTDGDGYMDLVSTYTHGVLDEVRYLSPINGLPLRVERMRLGKVFQADVDADRDGELDTRWLYGPVGEVISRQRMEADGML